MKRFGVLALVLFVGNSIASYLPDCPSNEFEKYHNCFGTYTFASGDKYVGEFKDGVRHGQGTYTYANGFIERGYYMNGDLIPDICKDMGLTKGSETFGQCVLKLVDKIIDEDD